MRQAPCFALIVTDTGQIWILKTLGDIRDCGEAMATILAVRDCEGRLQSTAEPGIRLLAKDTGGIAVGLGNRDAYQGARTALLEVLIELGKPQLHERALAGVRMCAARSRTKSGKDKANATVIVGGADALYQTFGESSKEVWSRLASWSFGT